MEYVYSLLPSVIGSFQEASDRALTRRAEQRAARVLQDMSPADGLMAPGKLQQRDAQLGAQWASSKAPGHFAQEHGLSAHQTVGGFVDGLEFMLAPSPLPAPSAEALRKANADGSGTSAAGLVKGLVSKIEQADAHPDAAALAATPDQSTGSVSSLVANLEAAMASTPALEAAMTSTPAARRDPMSRKVSFEGEHPDPRALSDDTCESGRVSPRIAPRVV